jgi:hypothetical protein
MNGEGLEMCQSIRHLTHKHRDPQTLAGGLSRQKLPPALRQMPAFTVMLRSRKASTS